MSLSDNFSGYRIQILDTLKQACQAEVDLNDEDMVNYLNLLRKNCIDTFVGLIQGAKTGTYVPNNIDHLHFIIPYMGFIVNFMEHIGMQPYSTEELIGSCCGLVGDIASEFGKESIPILDTEGIKSLLTRGRNSKSATIKKYAVWATKQLAKLRSM